MKQTFLEYVNDGGAGLEADLYRKVGLKDTDAVGVFVDERGETGEGYEIFVYSDDFMAVLTKDGAVVAAMYQSSRGSMYQAGGVTIANSSTDCFYASNFRENQAHDVWVPSTPDCIDVQVAMEAAKRGPNIINDKEYEESESD